MDEKRLLEIEEEIASYQREYGVGDVVAALVHELVAEVRRLRGRHTLRVTIPPNATIHDPTLIEFDLSEGAEPHSDVAKF